jgi:hypothetical protein
VHTARTTYEINVYSQRHNLEECNEFAAAFG